MENYFSHNLNFLRTRQKLSQANLGKLLGLKGTAISNWEKGTSHPDYSTLLKIIKIFGISADKLMMSKINDISEKGEYPETIVENEKMSLKVGNRNKKEGLIFKNQTPSESEVWQERVEGLVKELKSKDEVIEALQGTIEAQKEAISALKGAFFTK